MKFSNRKSVEEKKVILDELAGSGLEYDSEIIEEVLQIAFREGEEDREDLDIR